jgi:iron complex outermembrane receptor protein
MATAMSTNPGARLPRLSVNGEQVNKGVELKLFGESVDGLGLLAGATWMDTGQRKASSDLNRQQLPDQG